MRTYQVTFSLPVDITIDVRCDDEDDITQSIDPREVGAALLVLAQQASRKELMAMVENADLDEMRIDRIDEDHDDTGNISAMEAIDL